MRYCEQLGRRFLGGEPVGRYLNPGQMKFQQVLNSEIYVDITGMIAFLHLAIYSAKRGWCFDHCKLSDGKCQRAGIAILFGFIQKYDVRFHDPADVYSVPCGRR